MSAVELPKNPIANWEQVRDEWIARVTALVDQVEAWARDLGWSTRRISKALDDHEIGTYRVPALLLQEGTVRLLLEPQGRSAAPDTEGIVDLYVMPAYDDIANLYFYQGGWHVHYRFPGTPTGEGRPLSAAVLRELFEEMIRRAA
ncbi:MAG TPA: hypothetical protein VKD90_01985 [Gemmataceae bacterium]|nr:hypothetical protein [Gemmataceae bacterium]